MTGEEVYNVALSLVPELQSEVPDLNYHKLNWVNLAIGEAFEAENSIRRFEETPELTAIPKLASMKEDIPYHEDICRIALPYAIAENAFTDDDNDYRANKARQKFIAAINQASKATITEIVDCY